MELNFEVTPIQLVSNELNNIYMKREDLIPFSFGGNKVRIAIEFMKDMKEKKCNLMIAYGNSRSNLCRVIANLCYLNQIECWIISPIEVGEDYIETNNSVLVKKMVSKIITCKKNNVPETIQNVLKEAIDGGKKPYYIYDNENEKCTRKAYINCYNEILKFEEDKNLHFDYIFFASGTGTTQSGLVCGQIINNDKSKKIIGISNARTRERGKSIIDEKIERYLKDNNINYNIKDFEYDFIDDYVLNGYGKYNNEIENIVKDMYMKNGIPLDLTYTGKAYWGMEKYLKDRKISGKNILFIHTGGTPLFFDNIDIFKC